MEQSRIGIASTRAPLALAAAAFAAGIWLAGHLQRSPARWGISATLLAVITMAAAIKYNVRLAQTAALLALICVGSFDRVYTPPPRVVTPTAEFLRNERVEVTGHITNDGLSLPGSGQRERFDLETESIQAGAVSFTRPVGMRATLFVRGADEESGAQFPRLLYGQRVRFTARLRLPHNFGNPGAFDYESYLHGLGISTLASVRGEQIEILPGASGNRLGFWHNAVRRSILEHINSPQMRLWPQEDAPLFAAMIVGDDSGLLRDVREEFQETGVYHLLVVSGMNVALLAAAVFWLARRSRAPQWVAAVVTIALSVFYAYIAGMGVPIQRAVLMLSVFLVGRLLYRERAALNATGFAVLVVLAVSPMALFDAGFQLTFLALVAIAGISLPVLERTSGHGHQALRHFESTSYDLRLEPRQAQLRLDLRLVASRLAQFIGAAPARWIVTGVAGLLLAAFDLTVVSTITQAVLVLPMRMYFHRAAIIGLPANLLVLPLAGVLLNSGVATIALSYISLPLARVAGAIAAGSLHWALRCLAALSHFHVAQLRTPDPGLATGLVAAAGIVFALAAVRRRGLAAAGIAVLLVSAGLAAFWQPAPDITPGKLEITAIDVGQGDSLLVISPEGRTMLIDAGGSIGPVHGEFDFGEDVVSPYLWSRGLSRLDVVALTHAHGDHLGGLARVIENFQPRELWVGINPESPALDHLFQVAAANHVDVRRHTAGEVFDWAGTRIRVLAPPGDWQPQSRPKNDDSLALLLAYGNTSALLAGDVEKKMERMISTEQPQATVLKVAHHGSATSTTPGFLSAVHPQFAVISVGANNSFGHPRMEVLERLQDEHAQTFRTDRLGAITFLLDGKKVETRLDRSH